MIVRRRGRGVLHNGPNYHNLFGLFKLRLGLDRLVAAAVILGVPKLG